MHLFRHISKFRFFVYLFHPVNLRIYVIAQITKKKYQQTVHNENMLCQMFAWNNLENNEGKASSILRDMHWFINFESIITTCVL